MSSVFLLGVPGKLKKLIDRLGTPTVGSVAGNLEIIDGIVDDILLDTAELVNDVNSIDARLGMVDSGTHASVLDAIEADTQDIQSTLAAMSNKGNWVKDPNFLPRWCQQNNLWTIKEANATRRMPTESQFWNNIDDEGGYTTVVNADQYYEAVNETGEGLLTCLVFPCNSGAGANLVSTARITVDGTAYEIATAQIGASYVGYRPYIGYAIPFNPSITQSSEDEPLLSDYADQGWAATSQISGLSFGRRTVSATIPAPAQIAVLGLPALYFSTSIKVEFKLSDVTGLTGYYGRCGTGHHIFK